MFILGQLKPPYNEYFQSKAWDRYVDTLHEEGLAWWFNLDVPTLAAHLVPLASASRHVPIPSRLQFLSEAINRTATPEVLDTFYRRFLDHGDLDAAAAVIGAAVLSTLEIGRGFDRLAGRHEDLKALLRHQGHLSALTIAGLFYYKSLIAQCLENDHDAVIDSADKALAWSKRAGANNLRAHISIYHLHACIWDTRFDAIESMVADVQALCDAPDISYPAKAVLLAHFGIYEMVRGRVERSKKIIQRTVHDYNSKELSTFLRILVHNHAILHAAYSGDPEELQRLSTTIQALPYPADTPFHSSFLHYSLGIVFLNTNEPEKAVPNLRLADEKGKESGSPLYENHVMLLKGQILSDMDDVAAAERLLNDWGRVWASRGHNLYVIAGEMEIANMSIRRGDTEAARKRYENARNLWPLPSPVYVFARSAEFVKRIESALFPAGAAGDTRSAGSDRPVDIRAFGELMVRMEGEPLHESQWRGTRSKQLLKALIALGASDVPSERLTRLLWPDTADAMGNLKAAVWRLKHLGVPKNEHPLPWITLENRRLSLSPDLCRVDVLRFREKLTGALSDGAGIEEIREGLDLYTDDFLKNDLNEAWIVRRREALKSRFVDGVLALADRCDQESRPETAIPYLEKAVGRSPENPALYARLMAFHLRMGEPSKAHRVFRRAEDALRKAPGGSRPGALKRLADLLERQGG